GGHEQDQALGEQGDEHAADGDGDDHVDGEGRRDTTEHRQGPEAGPEHQGGEKRLVGKLGREDHHERGQDDGEVHPATVTNPPAPRWPGREDRLWPSWATGRLAGWQPPPSRVLRWLDQR